MRTPTTASGVQRDPRISGCLSSRAKHRKEVKKFHQRQKNGALRTETRQRDDQLFLLAGTRRRASCSSETGRPSSAAPSDGALVSEVTPASVSPPMRAEEDRWAFDFIFRHKPHYNEPELAGADADDTGSIECTHESAIVPSSFYCEVEQHLAALAEESKTKGLISALWVPSSSMTRSTSPNKIISNIHVRRVDGVLPIPVDRPMSEGTDLNMPTSNYLTIDRQYNVHQHAPGFVRDAATAMRSMVEKAVVDWDQTRHENVMVLLTGDAMRAVFEQTYISDKSLALQVKRVGPTLMIDAHTRAQTSVRSMRKRALTSKALYRLREECIERDTQPASMGLVTVPSKCDGLVGATTTRTKALHRYSQMLRWDIGTLEVMVGVDTPIILDRRDNTEHMVVLEDSSVPLSPVEMQHDALSRWFDATLANVPQVGIYVHSAGVIQKFEVKKVQDLLGLVEGRMATAAMAFTSNVLQWLVSQCVKDDSTYAVIRDYESDYLQLYELPRSKDVFCDVMADDVVAEGENMARTVDPAHGKKEAHRGTSETEEIHEESIPVHLARMCFGIGKHLFEDGATHKAHDALVLLQRSLSIFVKQPEVSPVYGSACEVAHMLPPLIERMLLWKLSQWREGVESTPGKDSAPGGRQTQPDEDSEHSTNDEDIVRQADIFRDALVTCGRFESILRDAMADAADNPRFCRQHLGALVSCSAALCVVVARALEVFSTERDAYIKAKRRSRSAPEKEAAVPKRVKHPTARPSREGHVDVHVRSLRTKDLLQVIVEGLVHLEQLNAAVETRVSVLHKDAAPPVKTRRSGADNRFLSGPTDMEEGRLIDPSTEVDTRHLHAALCELYGDVVLLTMADHSPFTAGVLCEISRRIQCRMSVNDVHTETVPDGGICPSANGLTTLRWLASLTSDPVSLSFTALRFYMKAGGQSVRIMRKISQMYLYLGLHYFRIDRYTKALEALHRAQALHEDAAHADEDTVFGGCFAASPQVQIRDIRIALADVYMRLAMLKAKANPAEVVVTQHQPLSIGALHTVTDEETRFTRSALNAYTQAGAKEQRAITLVHYAGAHLDMITTQGAPAAVDAVKHIYALLLEAQQVAPEAFTRQREWELLRLASAAAPGHNHGGLLKAAEKVLLQWSLVVEGYDMATLADCVEDIGSFPQDNQAAAPPLRVTEVEQGLQLALVCCVQVEHLRHTNKNPSRFADCHHALQQWSRRTAVFLVSAVDAHEKLSVTLRQRLFHDVVATWQSPDSTAWVYKMVSMIALRLIKAAQDGLPAKRRSEARDLFRRLLKLELERDACEEEGTDEASLRKGGSVGTTTYPSRLASAKEILNSMITW